MKNITIVPNAANTEAEVTIAGVTKTMRCVLINSERIHISGVALKYRTGHKIWNGDLILWLKSGNIAVSGGMDHRVRRSTCENVIGFYSDFNETK